MNLKHLTDNTLFQDTEHLVTKERETLTQLLHHFREIERRRLYSTIQLGSLYEYLTIKLNYPKDQAWRRIQAMHLLKEIPEIEEKINSGALSLTHMGMAQSFFKKTAKDLKKPYSKEQKLKVLEKFENTSTRDAEKVVIDLYGTTPVEYREVIKPYSKELSELRCAVSNDTLKKIEKLKGLRAHKNPTMTLSELIDQLCDLGLETWSPEKQNVRKTSKVSRQIDHELDSSSKLSVSRLASESGGSSKSDDANNNALLLAAPRVGLERPESQASINRQVWREAQGRCQNCKSVYALQTDHHWPKALGGSSAKENLRLLCRSCNQRAAIEAFGISKMARYLETNKNLIP